MTLDALHAQTATVKTLSDLNLHDVIGLKANQPMLYQAAQALHAQVQPLSTATEFDSSHGRQVQRTVRVYAAPPVLADRWHNLKTLIWV